MKVFKNKTAVLILGAVGLCAVIGTALCQYLISQRPAESHTPQEIAEMNVCPIDVNTASAEQLAAVPHLSQKQADSIVRYREENGAFSSIEDLINVKGIGKTTFERVRLYLVAE